MTIDELIAELGLLKKEHGGEVDVTVWQYGGGLDDLHDVRPVFDNDYGRVILETSRNADGIRR
jgi:hypothetical protein